jgi:hypothetical protein
LPRYLAFLVLVLGIAVTIAQSHGTTSQSEEDDFLSAIHRKSPEAKTAALESFLNRFPESRFKERSLEVLLETYWQLQRFPKFGNTLDELLKVNPDNLLGLTVKAESRCDNEPSPGLCEKEETEIANRGLRVLATATKPADMSEDDFASRKARGSFAFHRTLGNWALIHHDYQCAQGHLRTAAEIDPTNFATVYPLAIAYLNSDPPNDLQGLFFIARAAGLVNWKDKFQKQLADYGRREYVKYHGSEEGWPELLKSAKDTPLPPPGFTITPASKNP